MAGGDGDECSSCRGTKNSRGSFIGRMGEASGLRLHSKLNPFETPPEVKKETLAYSELKPHAQENSTDDIVCEDEVGEDDVFNFNALTKKQPKAVHSKQN